MSSNTNTNEAAEPKKGPVQKIRIGQCTVNIWENKNERTGSISNSATFDRRYRDKEGNWKSSDSYDLTQLLAHIEAATRAKDLLIAAHKGSEE